MRNKKKSDIRDVIVACVLRVDRVLLAVDPRGIHAPTGGANYTAN